MTEQVLGMLAKLDERSIRSIIWVTLEQAKLIYIPNKLRQIFSSYVKAFLHNN